MEKKWNRLLHGHRQNTSVNGTLRKFCNPQHAFRYWSQSEPYLRQTAWFQARICFGLYQSY